MPGKGKDTRVFKVTRVGGRVQYCARNAVSGMFGRNYYGPGGVSVARVHATNAEATEGWADVTEEFRNPQAEPGDGRCKRHPQYKGTRKPSYRWSKDILCRCWRIYGSAHPDYPRHFEMCDQPSMDPQHCDCRMTAKLFG